MTYISPFSSLYISSFSCRLNVAFPRRFVYQALLILCWLKPQSRSSLFSCWLQSLIYTLDILQLVFVSSSSFLAYPFASFSLFYSRRSHSRVVIFDHLIVFNSVSLVPPIPFYLSSSLQLIGMFFVHIKTNTHIMLEQKKFK